MKIKSSFCIVFDEEWFDVLFLLERLRGVPVLVSVAGHETSDHLLGLVRIPLVNV